MTENERLNRLKGWVVDNDPVFRLGTGNTRWVNAEIVKPVLQMGLSGKSVLLAPEDVGYVNRGLGYG